MSASQLMDLQWFAPDDEGKTEEPTEHKLKKAREEGRVPKSQDLNSTLVMLFSSISIIIFGPWLMGNFVEIIQFYFRRCTEQEINASLWIQFLHYFIKMVTPIALVAALAAIAGNVIQNSGFIFTTKTIEPKFDKIIPKFGEYLKKTLFSVEGAFNVFKSIAKVAAIFIIAYITIKNDLPTLLSLMNVNLGLAIKHIAGMVAKILIYTSLIFLVVAVPDYIVQRYQFRQQMKMTKQEVKEEFKEMEGDPKIKSKLRQMQQEIMSNNMKANVAESDVVIANPTHFAVAVKYEKEIMQGPEVKAKGQDNLAQQIKNIARENDVPIIENRPLARALYADVEIGDIIPEKYYTALATILGKVYSMKGKKID
ncbi:MAG: flagellar biosynthesis protein FlhB [Treponema sp. CETP13]|nr:MAG: flagellar biosynthesis protein FlhB [Treponema sp. CETP13]